MLGYRVTNRNKHELNGISPCFMHEYIDKAIDVTKISSSHWLEIRNSSSHWPEIRILNTFSKNYECSITQKLWKRDKDRYKSRDNVFPLIKQVMNVRDRLQLQAKKMACKHRSIQVVLNPSAGCFITKAVGSSGGNIIANVCVHCSQMKDNEDTFEEPKNYPRARNATKFILPMTKETGEWLEHCPFTKVSGVADEGITIYHHDTNLKVPSGTKWSYESCQEKICIGNANRTQQERLPIAFAKLALTAMLKDKEVEEARKRDEDPEDMLEFALGDLHEWLQSPRICNGNGNNEYVAMN